MYTYIVLLLMRYMGDKDRAPQKVWRQVAVARNVEISGQDRDVVGVVSADDEEEEELVVVLGSNRIKRTLLLVYRWLFWVI